MIHTKDKSTEKPSIKYVKHAANSASSKEAVTESGVYEETVLITLLFRVALSDMPSAMQT